MIFLLAVLLATAASAHPLRTTTQLPTEWVEVSDADGSQDLELLLFITQQNKHMLESTLLAVSDPSSSKYGEHLSQAEVHDLVAPHPEDIATVVAWLESHGLSAQPATPNSDILSVTATVAKAEALLGADYRLYAHSASGIAVHRALEFELPSEIAAVLDIVSPASRFPGVADERAAADGAPDGLFNTPTSLRERYTVGAAKGTNGTSGFRQAVTGFLGQFFSASDFAKFQKKYDADAVGQAIALVGDAAAGRGGVESMLDAEYITALGPNVLTEFWGFAGSSPDNKENEPFLKWLTQVSATGDDDVPKLFSTSYGEDEDSTTVDYAARCNVEFQKAGARGISLLFASGDSGVASTSGGCKGGLFSPKWPAGSPFVTAVGGTTGSPEKTAGLSSGGFSNYFPTPEWQATAAKEFIDNGGADTTKFNNTGRGFPDISAQATGFLVVAGGITNPGVAGTSCASPTSAGIFGLLNDQRVAAGKSTLGFLNPFIYQNSAAFNDITEGSNNGCSFSSKGFSAVKGWDPATGVGTPDFTRLSAAVAALP